jgi:diguanylate cyclase (GGDEF)-like protein
MQTANQEPVASALFRLLAVSCGFAAAGLLVPGSGGGMIVQAGTDELARLGLVVGARLPGRAPVALDSADGATFRIAPAAHGLAATFAAAAPVRRSGGQVVGWLLVADPRPRRLTPGTAALVADAAALAQPLVPAERPRGVTDAALRGVVRLRSAAGRMIDAALLRDDGAVLMMLDLDRFRSVNEALGTAAGDALLAVTAGRLERVLAGAGRVMRLDGDRFVIVARQPPDGDPAAVRALARRLLDAVSEPVVLDDRTISTQASIGVVAGLSPEVPTPSLLMQADAALRRAKIEGRNRFAFHGPAEAVATAETSRLELDLPGALADGQLRLVYQPYVDLSDDRISGVEALVRWQHPVRGALLPASFIPMAEASGHIPALGRWALMTALAAGVTWPAQLGLAVNISPLQFQQPGFLDDVDAALAATGFPPERLELEITETVLMRDNPETTAQLHALIERGIRIALDDFGTGYSALAYLARLPHHRIKLDKAFVQDLANPTTAELIRAIIALARAQGIAVTAEGVERPEHLALVRRTGFTHAQGFAIGAPLADPAGLVTEAPLHASAGR